MTDTERRATCEKIAELATTAANRRAAGDHFNADRCSVRVAELVGTAARGTGVPVLPVTAGELEQLLGKLDPSTPIRVEGRSPVVGWRQVELSSGDTVLNLQLAP